MNKTISSLILLLLVCISTNVSGQEKDQKAESADHNAARYLVNPISDFLKSDIETINITANVDGCYQSDEIRLSYKQDKNKDLCTHQVTGKINGKKISDTFKYKIKTAKLLPILSHMNTNPCYSPTIKDFDITAKDKKNYQDRITEYIRDDSANYLKKNDKIFLAERGKYP